MFAGFLFTEKGSAVMMDMAFDFKKEYKEFYLPKGTPSIVTVPNDDEPATVEALHSFMEGQGYELDITDQRYHHEIYLSDARKAAPEKLRTLIRHPIKRKES